MAATQGFIILASNVEIIYFHFCIYKKSLNAKEMLQIFLYKKFEKY